MASDSFVHLHVHSEYSMLDGAARIGPMVQEAARQGMPAIAVTDHGNLFGAYEFYKASKKSSVKPIIGLEAYVTPKTHRSERKRVRWGDKPWRDTGPISQRRGTGSPALSRSPLSRSSLSRLAQAFQPVPATIPSIRR